MVRKLLESESLQGTLRWDPFKLAAAGMFAAGMLQQSSGGLNKRSLGMARLPNSHFFPLSSGSGSWGLGRSAKSGSLSSVSSGSDSMDMAGADPDYIMQLVNEVRRFADVLLHLKEAFNTKGKSETAQGWRKELVVAVIVSTCCGSMLALVSRSLTSHYLFWIMARESLFAIDTVNSFNNASNLKQR